MYKCKKCNTTSSLVQTHCTLKTKIMDALSSEVVCSASSAFRSIASEKWGEKKRQIIALQSYSEPLVAFSGLHAVLGTRVV